MRQGVEREAETGGPKMEPDRERDRNCFLSGPEGFWPGAWRGCVGISAFTAAWEMSDASAPTSGINCPLQLTKCIYIQTPTGASQWPLDTHVVPAGADKDPQVLICSLWTLPLLVHPSLGERFAGWEVSLHCVLASPLPDLVPPSSCSSSVICLIATGVRSSSLLSRPFLLLPRVLVSTVLAAWTSNPSHPNLVQLRSFVAVMSLCLKSSPTHIHHLRDLSQFQEPRGSW